MVYLHLKRGTRHLDFLGGKTTLCLALITISFGYHTSVTLSHSYLSGLEFGCDSIVCLSTPLFLSSNFCTHPLSELVSKMFSSSKVQLQL